MSGQFWVTSVVSEESLQQAMVLCSSLKRVHTTRKLALLVSPNTAFWARQVLNHAFDLVIYLEEDYNLVGLKYEDFTKVYSVLALRAADLCCYLDPTIIALKNFDNIFDNEIEETILFSEEEKPRGQMDTSIFLFLPGRKSFQVLMDSLKTPDIGVHHAFHNWSGLLCEKFNEVKSVESLISFHDDDGEILLLNLLNYPKDLDFTAVQANLWGNLGNDVKKFLDQVKQDVIPLLEEGTISKEIMKCSGKPFHPLVGSRIPNATSFILFQSEVNLQNVKCMRDHFIGKHAILPGAGYLEMCLASGLAAVQDTSNPKLDGPIKVENLTISGHCEIDDRIASRLQICVNFNTQKEGEGEIKIFQGRNNCSPNNSPWLPLATATFSHVTTDDDREIPFDVINLKKIMAKPNQDELLSDFYSKLENVGVKLGSSFKSISHLWKTEGRRWSLGGTGATVLAKIKVPFEDPQYSQWVVHPVILETMIQSILLLKFSSMAAQHKLLLTTKIGKFVSLLGDEEMPKELYVQACEVSNEACAAMLLDRTGRVLVVISGVEFSETTACAIEAVLKEQKTPFPEMWEQIFAPDQLGLNLKAIGNAKTPTEIIQICKRLSDTEIAKSENISKIIPSLKELPIPLGATRYKLHLPESKNLPDLKFEPVEFPTLNPGQIEIRVKYSGLNYGDLLSILKPSSVFEKMNQVGIDFSGIITRIDDQVTKWKVGDHVFGMNMHTAPGKYPDCLPSHICLQQEDVIAVPSAMTLAEACSLPVAFATSYYCLVKLAKIKPDDTVLIHTASGGVGLTAIDICKNIGATVLVTASDSRKENFLKRLGISHVFSSRDTSYSEEILQLTNGQGVDIVLNFLTDPGFKEATLKVCGKGARFVEMSKLNIWKPVEVKLLRPDVLYRVVDIYSVGVSETRRLMYKLEELISQKIIRPVPYTRFNGVSIQQALEFIERRQHIGRVVVTMPEVKISEAGIRKVFTPIFQENASYLIAGNLGGVAIEVCKWMVDKGARYIILGTKNVVDLDKNEMIGQLNSEKNGKVVGVELDVSRFEDCKDFIQAKMGEMGYPDLRGVMHFTGDGREVEAEIEEVFNFHRLTEEIPNLEHFVLFSSLSAVVDLKGQNLRGSVFENTFVRYRHSLGLPATSIIWGPWGDLPATKKLGLPGWKPMSVKHGLNGLEYCLHSQRMQTIISNCDLADAFVKSTHNQLNDLSI